MKKLYITLIALALFTGCQNQGNPENVEYIDSTQISSEPMKEIATEDKPDYYAELGKYIEKESNGFLSIRRYALMKSKKIEFRGEQGYDFEGKLTVNVLKSCYHITWGEGKNGIFGCQEALPETHHGGWEIAKYEYYEAGTTVSYTEFPLHFTKYDQGWKLEDIQYR